jgi:hypothetical protein
MPHGSGLSVKPIFSSIEQKAFPGSGSAEIPTPAHFLNMGREQTEGCGLFTNGYTTGYEGRVF